MSPEKSMSDPTAKRQKIMIAVIVIIVLIVAYNVMGMFRGGGTPNVVPSSPPISTAAGNKPASSNQTPGGNAATVATPGTSAMQQPVQTRVQTNAEIMRLETQTQNEYLTDLSNLQLLKVQRQIAETKQAIAAAKLATITAETSIADSLIGTSVNRVQQPTTANVELNTTPSRPEPIMNVMPYTLMSVSFQGRKWTAVIKANTKLLIVSVGDKLPDGSIVQDIDRNGITIKKDTIKTRLTLTNAL